VTSVVFLVPDDIWMETSTDIPHLTRMSCLVFFLLLITLCPSSSDHPLEKEEERTRSNKGPPVNLRNHEGPSVGDTYDSLSNSTYVTEKNVLVSLNSTSSDSDMNRVDLHFHPTSSLFPVFFPVVWKSIIEAGWTTDMYNISEECKSELHQYVLDLKEGKDWATNSKCRIIADLPYNTPLDKIIV